MGTLGCINDMLRRDKENRELRRIGRERMNDTRNRLINTRKAGEVPNISIEQLDEIRQKTQEREKFTQNNIFRIRLIMLGLILVTGLLVWFFSLLFL